jgi:hypothetical protein
VYDLAVLRPAVDDLRANLQADGADLTVEEWDEAAATLRLRLLLHAAGCAECVLPKQELEQVALYQIAARLPGVRRVEIADPRPAPAGDGP